MKDFNRIKTPEELMKYLDDNIYYGVIDGNGDKILDSDDPRFSHACISNWKTRPISKILASGIGHCYDQVEIEREWFEKNSYLIHTFWICVYQEETNNSGFTHTYLIFKDGENYKLFEHADAANRGIYTFKSIKEAVKWQMNNQIRYAEDIVKPNKKYSVVIKEYKKPKYNLSFDNFINYVDSFPDFVV